MESGAILDAQITASSQYDDHHGAYQGRLHFQQSGMTQGGWKAVENAGYQWLQVDLGGQRPRVTRVATQGRNSTDWNEWVTRYKIRYSDDAITFWCYIEQGQATDKVKLHSS